MRPILLQLMMAALCLLPGGETAKEWLRGQEKAIAAGDYAAVTESFLAWYERYESASMDLETARNFRKTTDNNFGTVVNILPQGRPEETVEVIRSRVRAYTDAMLFFAVLDERRFAYQRIAEDDPVVAQHRLAVLLERRTNLLSELCRQISWDCQRDGVMAGWTESLAVRHDAMRAMALWSRLLVDHYEPDFTPKYRSMGANTAPLDPMDSYRLARKSMVYWCLNYLYSHGRMIDLLGSMFYKRKPTEELEQYMILAGRSRFAETIDWKSKPAWLAPPETPSP